MNLENKKNFIRLVAIVCAFSVWSCGTDEAKDDEVEAAAGDKILYVPFALGALASVDGAGSEKVTFNYNVGAEAAAMNLHGEIHAEKKAELLSADNPSIMDMRAFEQGKRMLIRLFDRDKGQLQNPALGNIARELDDVVAVSTATTHGLSLAAAPQVKGYEALVQKWIQAPKKQEKNRKMSANLTAAGCPVTDDEVVRPDADLEEDVADVSETIDETDFCLVIVSDPTTVTTAEAKTAMTSVIKTYKKLYADEFTGATDFTFKPVVVIVDFKDSEYWEADSEVLSTISGVFIPQMSDITKYPMIYMASDVASVLNDTSSDAATLKRYWYGTLAHEMQHAISDFYKSRKTVGKPETVAIEEGQAHFMEALFGYGKEVYDIHAKPFLGVFAFGTEPILRSNDIFKLSGRGAAYALLYYLASQKGGVTFTDGVATGGDGLKYIIDLVKDADDEGASHLSSEFGGSWVTTIKNYIGALAVDGTDIEDIADENTVEAPVTGVKDLEGGTGNSFGFRFNGGDIESHLDEYEAIDGDTFKEEVEQTFYGFLPALHTVGDAGEKVTITTTVEADWGFTKIKVK